MVLCKFEHNQYAKHISQWNWKFVHPWNSFSIFVFKWNLFFDPHFKERSRSLDIFSWNPSIFLFQILDNQCYTISMTYDIVLYFPESLFWFLILLFLKVQQRYLNTWKNSFSLFLPCWFFLLEMRRQQWISTAMIVPVVIMSCFLSLMQGKSLSYAG